MTRLRSAIFGGFVLGVPRGTENLRRRFLLVVAGGPLASLAAIFVCGSGAWLTHVPAPGLSQQLWMVAACSLLALLPLKSAQGVNDAARMRMLYRGGQEADRTTAQQLIANAALSGVRPRAWDADLLTMAATPADGSPDAMHGQALRYYRLLDDGAIDEAEGQLAWLLTHTSHAVFRINWQLQAAYLAGYFRRDAATARKWLNAAGHRVPAHLLYALPLAEAAVAFAEERWSDAGAAALVALDECSRMVDRGSARMFQEAMLDLQSRAAPAQPLAQPHRSDAYER